MILREIIQRVLSLYNRGVHTQDTRLTPRHSYSALISARSTLLKQKADKNQRNSQWNYQTLPCVELVKSSVHECGCVPPAGCIILRSKYKLPRPITGMDSSLIQSISSLDGGIAYDFTTFSTNKYSAGNKYTAKKAQYFIHNGYLFITIVKMVKAVTIVGLFDDVIAAATFPSVCEDCDPCDCIDMMDIDFPIDGDSVRPLLQLANDELILMFKQALQDKSNNTADDTNGPPAGSNNSK